MKRPIGIDLFAGAGGMSLGFEQAGFEVVAAVEVDPIHAAAHEYNFPNCTTICRSVIGLTGREIRKIARLGDRPIDVVFGGAPCQGFSMIGKRALDDPRNQLVHHFVRLVVELDATHFVFENVRGLTLGKHRAFLQELIESFRASGYDVVEPYQVLNAADFGVPQDRRRLFIYGARTGMSVPAYPRPTNRTTVAEAITDIPDADQFPELLESDSTRVRMRKASTYAMRLRCEANDPTDFSHPREFMRGLLTSSTRTVHTKVSSDRFAATVAGDTEPVSRFHKLDPAGVCNTIRAGTDSARGAFTSPRPIHPTFPRVITVREAARLHSYPDWFRFHQTKWHGFRQIGNSVPPLLGRAVASTLLQSMGIKPSRPTKALALGDSALLKLDMSSATAYFGLESKPIKERDRKTSAPSAGSNPKCLVPKARTSLLK